MSASRTILGPDGAPLLTAADGRVLREGQALEAANQLSLYRRHQEYVAKRQRALAAVPEVVEGVVVDADPYAQLAGGVPTFNAGDTVVDVAKRARARQSSIAAVYDRERGRPKPTPITYEVLRLMATRSEWVRAIIKTRKNQIGKAKWNIKVKDTDDASGATRRIAKAVERLLKRPSMHGSNPHSRSWRQFLGEILEDILVIDAGCIEKERDQQGWIVAMYPVDGATIRPNMDENGSWHDDAYVQIVDGQVTARFGMEDLIYVMDNPQTDVRYAGYGLSPLENLVVSCIADIHASKYNSSYFQSGAVPEGILHIGDDASPDDVNETRLYWMNEILGRPWALPIIGGAASPEFIKFRESNRDMQFMEYQDWLLKKMCAVYQIAPQEIGILEDVNRSTADSQDETNDDKSIEPIKSLLHDFFEVEVIGEHGLGLGDYIEFEWEEAGEPQEQVIERFTAAIPMGAASRKEFRDALGLEARPEPALDELFTDSQLVPLPNAADIDASRVSTQQKREDDQAKTQQDGEQAQREHEQAMNGGGGPTGNMPWKPATPGTPGLADAQAQHDEENGIGVRNKTADDPVDVTKDRDPALTEQSESIEDMLRREDARLWAGLSAILRAGSSV